MKNEKQTYSDVVLHEEFDEGLIPDTNGEVNTVETKEVTRIAQVMKLMQAAVNSKGDKVGVFGLMFDGTAPNGHLNMMAYMPGTIYEKDSLGKAVRKNVIKTPVAVGWLPLSEETVKLVNKPVMTDFVALVTTYGGNHTIVDIVPEAQAQLLIPFLVKKQTILPKEDISKN